MYFRDKYEYQQTRQNSAKSKTKSNLVLESDDDWITKSRKHIFAASNSEQKNLIQPVSAKLKYHLRLNAIRQVTTKIKNTQKF